MVFEVFIEPSFQIILLLGRKGKPRQNDGRLLLFVNSATYRRPCADVFMQVCLRQTCEGGRDVLFQSPVFSARIKLGSEDSPISLNRPIYASFDFSQNSERTGGGENQSYDRLFFYRRPKFAFGKLVKLGTDIHPIAGLSLHCNVRPPSDTYAPVRRTHSLEWDIHTRSGGVLTLARVGYSHSLGWLMHTRTSVSYAQVPYE